MCLPEPVGICVYVSDTPDAGVIGLVEDITTRLPIKTGSNKLGSPFGGMQRAGSIDSSIIRWHGNEHRDSTPDARF